jgi:hypothetical protein
LLLPGPVTPLVVLLVSGYVAGYLGQEMRRDIAAFRAAGRVAREPSGFQPVGWLVGLGTFGVLLIGSGCVGICMALPFALAQGTPR